MKKFTKTLFIFSVMLVSILAMGNVSSAKVIEVNSTTFPDETIRQTLRSYATDTGDVDTGFKIDTKEVTELYLYASSGSIKSLKGIELLTELKKLTLSSFKGSKISLNNSQLKTFSIYHPDCTKLQIQIPKVEELVVYDSYNMSSIDVSANKNLKDFTLFAKKVKSVDVSKNTKLTNLKLKLTNNSVSPIDISKNTNLSTFIVSAENLKSVDVSKNKNLKELCVSGSKYIKSVNISNNTKLTALSLTYMKVNKIDISKHTKLTAFACYGSKITSLNLSKNRSLTSLDVSHTGLKNLDITKNSKLTSLNVSDTKLKSLNLTKNNKLTLFNMSNTNFKLPDLSKKTNLVSLYLANTKITALNLAKFTKLERLDVSGTKLNNLDLTKNTKLTLLYVSDTELTSLNLKNNKKLREIGFSASKIKELDLSGYEELTIRCKVKKNSKLNLKPYLGTGYECSWTYNEDYFDYDDTKNMVSVSGKSGQWCEVDLHKGTSRFRILIDII